MRIALAAKLPRMDLRMEVVWLTTMSAMQSH